MRDTEFWRHQVYRLAALACVTFVVMTLCAMLLYGGGTVTDPIRPGYSFFQNFFSDLGMTVASSGRSNLASLVLFVTA